MKPARLFLIFFSWKVKGMDFSLLNSFSRLESVFLHCYAPNQTKELEKVESITRLKTRKQIFHPATWEKKKKKSSKPSLSCFFSLLVVLVSRGRVQLTAAGLDQVLNRARHSLLSLSIRRTSLPVDEMRISQLEALCRLDFRSCRYTPGHFSTLSTLQHLQRLILSQPVNEAEAVAIGKLTKLEVLHIRPYLAPSAALAHPSHLSHLSSLTRLVSIDLSNALANDDALSRLHPLRNLTSLCVFQASFPFSLDSNCFLSYSISAGLTEDTSLISAAALRALGSRLASVRHIGGFYHLLRDNDACKALCCFV